MRLSDSRRYVFVICIGIAIVAGCGSQQIGQPPPAPQKKLYYVVQNIGSFGGTGCCNVVTDNDRGWVNGTSNLPGNKSFHPFLWRNGTLKDLGTLGGPNASVGGMNDQGDVTVGGSDTGTPDPLGEDYCGFGTHQTCLSYVWHEGKRTLIPTLGGNNNDVNTINNHGLVLAFAETTIHDPSCIAPQVLGYEAFTWEPATGKIHRLPPLKGDSVSVAFDMNDRGDAAGYSGVCGNGGGNIFGLQPADATLWRHGKPIYLGSLGGTVVNTAFGVNNRGQVAGISALHGNKTAHAFVWQNGTMTDLGTLPGDHLSLSGNINDSGQVPIQSCKSVAVPKCRAAVWQGSVMTDLNTLIRSGSSLYLTAANWINNHGDVVGTARDRDTHALVPFLAIRCDPNGALVKACTQKGTL